MTTNRIIYNSKFQFQKDLTMPIFHQSKNTGKDTDTIDILQLGLQIKNSDEKVLIKNF